MKAIGKLAVSTARLVLCCLIAIHLILPFTAVNTHSGIQIVIASVILGMVNLGLLLWSRIDAHSAFACALILLFAVYGISHMGGASPILEGWPIKVLFAGGLAWGLATSPRARRGFTLQ